MMISVAIVNFNEAVKLEKCLNSVKDFAVEIVVVDLGSEDESEKICKKFGAKIFAHRKEPFVELVRDFSISKVTGDWILVLDPDEEISESLKKRLKEIVRENNYDAVNIPRKNIFFGKWIAHTNWWPDKHIRFFKKGKVKWSEKIHSYPKVEGKVLNLEANPELAIIHFGYDNLSQFLERQNRYSEIEAEQLYKSGIHFSWGKFLWWPTREFLVRLIKHQGYLDGIYGISLVFLIMVYKMIILVKLREREDK